MQKYYSVDRRGAYATAKDNRITLWSNTDPNGNDIHAHINKLYPDGFSNHGGDYYRNVPLSLSDPREAEKRYRSHLLDLLLEACRKSHFPDKPCRYQSVFACETIDEAMQFRTSSGKPTDPIFELKPEGRVHRGDMTVYAMTSTMAALDHRLHLYWEGNTLDIPAHKPVWEHVMALPVLVGDRVA